MFSLVAVFGVGAVLGAVAAVAYISLLVLQRDTVETTAYRVFRIGYPVATVILVSGATATLYAAGRFHPIEWFGLSIDPSLVRTAGLVAGLMGLVAVSILSVWVAFDPKSRSG